MIKAWILFMWMYPGANAGQTVAIQNLVSEQECIRVAKIAIANWERYGRASGNYQCIEAWVVK